MRWFSHRLACCSRAGGTVAARVPRTPQDGNAPTKAGELTEGLMEYRGAVGFYPSGHDGALA